VWITLGERDGHVAASVRDDGAGFDTGTRPRSAFGLVGMRYRVEAEGGALAVHAAPGRGTLIEMTLPVAAG
jgi:signal transduction histidine kinase